MNTSQCGPDGIAPETRFNMARYCLTNAIDAPMTREKTALLVVHDPHSREVESWRYRALEDAVLRTAYMFRAKYNLAPGSRVVIRLKNRTCYAIAFFGAIAGGLVPVPASPDLTERELTFILDDCEAAAIVLDDTLPHGNFTPELLVISKGKLTATIESGANSGYADTGANDPAFLVYTSGTTADPKGVLHAHRTAWGRRPMYRDWYGLTRQDRLMHAGSFNWTYTLGTGLTDPWANGATSIVYTGEKDPALWPRLLKDNGVTIFAGVPGVYRQILKYSNITPHDIPALRHGLAAGETLRPAVASEWQERTQTILYEALGQSELSTYISSSPEVPVKPGRIGKPQRGRVVAILPEEGGASPVAAGEAGLIAVHRSDPGLMLGYWRRETEEAEVFRGDWFIGGDSGFMDEEGYIAHLGRKNDLMNAGGFRVSPMEVEQVLAKHPFVGEIAVAEVEIRQDVSIIMAFVVPRDGHGADIVESLARLAGERLASYKRPKDYVIMTSLPKTLNGKVKRSELRAGFPGAER